MNAAKQLIALVCAVVTINSSSVCLAAPNSTSIAQTALELQASVKKINRVQAGLDAARANKTKLGYSAVFSVALPMLTAAFAILSLRLSRLPDAAAKELTAAPFQLTHGRAAKIYAVGTVATAVVPPALGIAYMSEDQIVALQKLLEDAKSQRLAALQALNDMGVNTESLVLK